MLPGFAADGTHCDQHRRLEAARDEKASGNGRGATGRDGAGRGGEGAGSAISLDIASLTRSLRDRLLWQT